MYIKEVPNAGLGAFCSFPLKKNQFITEYTGEMFKDKDKNKDEEDKDKDGDVIDEIDEIDEIWKAREKLFLNTFHTYFYNLDFGYVIDATDYGNWGRYLNHSHNPNCHTY